LLIRKILSSGVWYDYDMKFILSSISSLVLLLLPLFSYAASAQQKAAEEAANFVMILNRVIIFPLIALLSAVAFFVFLWGCAQYIFNAANEQSRQQGVKHITYGVIGLIVMLSAFTILTIISATFGLDDELTCAADDKGCSKAFIISP